MKTCVKLGLEECPNCQASWGAYECWVDFYKRNIMNAENIIEAKKYIIEKIYEHDKTKYYVIAAAKSISTKYSSCVDKILTII